ncbi:MAG TPA: energy transducer TonB, partial [Holophagaceae bacterium]|nr:energy transducer TonB [Holophagaceae bacterium]
PSGGLRPALPPTLQPMAIALAAPRTDRRTALLASAVIYLFIPAALMAAGRAMPHGVETHGKGPITFDLIEPGTPGGGPPPPVLHRPEPVPPSGLPTPVAPDVQEPTDQIPLDTPNTLPTADFSGMAGTDSDAPGLPGGMGCNSNSHIPGPGGEGGGDAIGTGRPITLEATALRILHQEAPGYPALARAMKVQGQVVLRMVIDANGIPTTVIMQEGNPVFRTEAERSARLWRFEPAQVNGTAVAATFLLTLKFKLA